MAIVDEFNIEVYLSELRHKNKHILSLNTTGWSYVGQYIIVLWICMQLQ